MTVAPPLPPREAPAHPPGCEVPAPLPVLARALLAPEVPAALAASRSSSSERSLLGRPTGSKFFSFAAASRGDTRLPLVLRPGAAAAPAAADVPAATEAAVAVAVAAAVPGAAAVPVLLVLAGDRAGSSLQAQQPLKCAHHTIV